MTTITLADIVKEEQEFLKSNTKMTSKEDSCMCPMIEGCYAIFDQSLEYIQKIVIIIQINVKNIKNKNIKKDFDNFHFNNFQYSQ